MEIRSMYNVTDLKELRAEVVADADKAISEENPDDAQKLIEKIKEIDERLKALEENQTDNEGEERRMNNFVKPNIENNETHEVKGFKEYVNSMGKETRNTVLADGVAVVPDEIMTNVIEKTENVLTLSQIVNVVKVQQGKGEVPFMKSQANPLPTVLELEESPLLAATPVTPIPFEVQTHRSYLLISNELREDNQSNLVPMLQNYMKRSIVATDNKLVLDQLNTLSPESSSQGIDAIKKAIHVDLYANGYDNISILVNASTYNTMNTLKDSTGRYILAENVGASPYKTIDGVPVIPVPDAQLEGNRVYIGSFKDAVALFDRSEVQVQWEQYLNYGLSLGVAIRRDAKIIDGESVKALDLTFVAEPVV
ncbi:phage major capsid protein [Staphylococcus equorum]|uniref:phage major capsid protein n=1 Tax=Staphylococcus equorum TaxID=246432 RepID=UPI000D1C4AE9|nr:phage major capsid protein [Staphylococcus equorum]PTF10533.1 phage major capsid protein [Staphylococcus equorum]